MSGNAYRTMLAAFLALVLGQSQASEILATKLGLVRDPWSVMQVERRIEWGDKTLGLAELCLEPSWPSMSRQSVALLALCRRSGLEVAWHGWQAAAAREGQAYGRYLPTVRLTGSEQLRSTSSIDAGQGRPNLVVPGESEITRRSDISAEWTLLTFGARSAALDRLRHQTEAARLEYDNQVDSVLLEAFTAFENLLGAQQVARLQQESLGKAQDSVTLATTRFSHNVGSLADVKSAEVVLLRARIELERTQAEIAQRRFELAAALSLTNGELDRVALVDTDGGSGPVEVGDFLSQLPQHKELQAAQAASTAARLQVTAVAREANPIVSAVVSYGNLSSQRRDLGTPAIDRREMTIGVQVNLPLFSGFSGYYKLREAQSQVDYQLGQTEVVRDRLQANGLQNQQALQLEQMQLESWSRIVELSQFNMSATRQRYLRGISDISFVLSAEREAAAALTEQSRAQTRFQVAKWKHMRDMGSIRARIR